MDKFDYITATIEEEKVRVEKIIKYLKENNLVDELPEYQERYNNILKYLTAKERYFKVLESVKLDKEKLEELNRIKDEYEVDNILLEDTLLSKFNEDTFGKYRNVLYEDIKNQDKEVQDILYLLLEKQSNYSELVIKRDRLKDKIDKNKYPKTYNTLYSQDIIIEKQDSILEKIFVVENSIKIEKDKLSSIEDSVMTDSILKLLYEFWIVNSYDPSKVDKTKLFITNKTFTSYKNNIPEVKKEVVPPKEEYKEIKLDNLKLPGLDEKKKVNRPLVYAILGVTLLVLAVSGSAYAFFTAQATSDQFSGNTIDVQIKKPVVTLVVGDKTKGLIPIHDGSVTGHTTNQLTTAVSGTNKCVDKNGYMVCHVYKVTLSNEGSTATTVDTSITLNTGGAANVTWAKMTNQTTFGSLKGTDNSLAKGTALSANGTADLYFVVYLKNTGSDQTGTDAGKTYKGTVTVVASTGSTLEAQF